MLNIVYETTLAFDIYAEISLISTFKAIVYKITYIESCLWQIIIFDSSLCENQSYQNRIGQAKILNWIGIGSKSKKKLGWRNI